MTIDKFGLLFNENSKELLKRKQNGRVKFINTIR